MGIINIGTIRGGKKYIKKIVDDNTIQRLTTAKLLGLPFKEIDPEKDQRWNYKKINGELLQAFENGETITQMSERLERVSSMNEVAAIRNARTMTTSFENLGRLDGMKKMKDNGTILKKQWLATISTKKHKTRDWHKELSGQTAEIDEPFINHPNGGGKEEIMYPGDPNASAANVYNCRCTLTAIVEGFESTLPKGTEKILDKDETTENYLTGKIKVIGTYNSEETIDLSGKKLYYSSGYDVMTPTQKAAVKEFEKKYYGEFEESLLLVDKQGKQVAIVNGKYGRIELPKNAIKNSEIITHTHFRAPFAERGMLGGPFSVSDMNTFTSTDLNVMRAVAPEGTYTIVKNDTFNANGLMSILRAYQSQNKPNFGQGVLQKEVIEYTNRYLIGLHNTFRKNAKEYGYTYFLEKGVIK